MKIIRARRLLILLAVSGAGLMATGALAVSIGTRSVANHGNSSCQQSVTSTDGATTLQARGRVSGDAYCEYRLGLHKGQRLTAWFQGQGAVHAVLTRPPGVDLVDGQPWTAPADDAYVLRVEAVGGDRRSHDFSLKVEVR